MQENSIYSENYKPLFINEMENEKIKEFSKTLSQKMRHVKMAISKATLGQNKYASLGDGTDNPKNDEKIPKQKNKNKNKLKPISSRRKSHLKDYIGVQKKDMTSNEKFEHFMVDFNKQLDNLRMPLSSSVKRAKIPPINKQKLLGDISSLKKE